MQIEDVAPEFAKRYKVFWRDGATDPDLVYSRNAILCGYDIVKAPDKIGATLRGIVAQGWRDIDIEIVQSAEVENMVLLACKYTARGAEDVLNAKSSYVLV